MQCTTVCCVSGSEPFSGLREKSETYLASIDGFVLDPPRIYLSLGNGC